MGTDYVQNRITLTGRDLKIIACISMLVDHAALIFAATGIPELILRHMIGRLAFPIFAFLLVQGFQYTKNLKKYFTGLFFFALVSELPYDLAIVGANRLSPEFTRQNTLFTLCLGLIMLWSIKKAETLLLDRGSAFDQISIVRLLVILVFGAAAQKLNLDYGFIGMACIGAIYCFRFDRIRSHFMGCICLNLNFFSMPGAFFSLLPISLYNGSRGKQSKYFFYLFYPLHLILLFCLKNLFIAG